MTISCYWRNEVESVVYRPRFGGDSQARTPQLVWASWRETQLGRNQLERFSWTGTSYSHKTGTQPTGFSYVYKYQIATQVEYIVTSSASTTFHVHLSAARNTIQ